MLTVGEILKTARDKKGLSLQDIEKKIRVRSKFLAAVERNDWSQFTSNVYISGIIKNYATFLEIDSNRALAFLEENMRRGRRIPTLRENFLVNCSYLNEGDQPL